MSTAPPYVPTNCGSPQWHDCWFGAHAATNAERWATLAIPKWLTVDGVPVSALLQHPVWLPADAYNLHGLQRYMLTAARVMNKYAQQTNLHVAVTVLEILFLTQPEHIEKAKVEWLANNWQTTSARLLTKWLVIDGLGVVYINRCYTHSGIEFEDDEEDGFASLKHLPAEPITWVDTAWNPDVQLDLSFSHLPQCFVELLRMLRTSDIQWRFENEVLHHGNNLPRDLHVKLNGFQLQQESSSDLGFWTACMSSLLGRTDDFNLSNSDMDKHDRKVMGIYMRTQMTRASNDGHKLADTLQANGKQQFACVVNGVNEQLDAILGLSPEDAAMGELQSVLFAAKDAALQLRNAEMVMEAAEMSNIVDGLRDTLGVEKRSRIFEFADEVDDYDYHHTIHSGERTTYENSFLYNSPLEPLCADKFVLAAIQVIITDFVST